MLASASMSVANRAVLPIRSQEDIVRVRKATRENAIAQGFSLVDQTKLVTAASEIARNTLDYGNGGEVEITRVLDGPRKGVRLTFSDQGPGIADLEKALTDGYSTGGGLGLGLSGARRLSSEFTIDSAPGKGTRIMIARWR
ncbi:MAG: serine/threonine-protein kinase RsbT [Gammaproteobacteria bacterium]|nr:serine/threonine-protein kinase RsbT [Gammaproteobacteria bacterium]